MRRRASFMPRPHPMPTYEYACTKCHHELEVFQSMSDAPLKKCPACKRDVHCCKGCQHYDRSLNNECREPQADWVSEKERRNFCDFFLVSERPVAKKTGKQDLNEKWGKLFKKP